MTRPRSQLVDINTTPYYHCVNRCVRRAFLCGVDHFTGTRYEHRRGWIVDRIKFLSSVFAFDVCAYAMMSNHYHVILRVDKEAAETWSDKEVAERWTQLSSAPLRVSEWLHSNEQSSAELRIVKETIETWRQRLWDISWFMRYLNESIAREANREDACKGRFWEGRFKSQALLDKTALLSCMAYVDLNPVRAGLSRTPEESDFTSIQERIRQLAKKKQEASPTLLPFADETAAGKEPVPFCWQEYLKLVDWTGRAILEHKRGAIPEHYPPILLRLGIKDSDWIQRMLYFEKHFPTVAGELRRMQQLAEETGRKWIRGMRQCFKPAETSVMRTR